VANRSLSGGQCTVLWHVDNLKVSHVDKKVVETIIELLNSEFGKETPPVLVHGKVHAYLGMHVDYSIPGDAHAEGTTRRHRWDSFDTGIKPLV
jgi:hypothetical protein